MLIVKRGLLALVALAGLLVLHMFVAQASRTAGTPALAVDQMEIDHGKVLRGETPRYVFVLRNTGSAPLEIRAKPTCGCTIARYEAFIPPGREGKIEADLKTSSFRGRTVKTIEVTSNDPQNPRLNLRMAANVVPVVQIIPQNFSTFAVKDTEPTTRILFLRLRDTEPVQLTRVTCSAPYATVEAKPLNARDGSSHAYKLTLTVQPNAPLGRSIFVLTAFTTSKKEPEARITITCEKGIVAVPSSVYMGKIRPNTPLPISRIVTLTRHEGAFRIQKVESSDANLQVKEEAVQGGTQHRLTLTYRGEQKEGLVRSKVTVTTDDRRQPQIEIPVITHVMAQRDTNQ